MSGFNLADLFEIVVDADPDREVLVAPARRLTLAQLDERSNRLAHFLLGCGVRRGDHVGLHLTSGTEYVEGMLACFKLSLVPINLNYRYATAELQQLYQDADLVAVIHHRQFSSRIAEVTRQTPLVAHVMVVEDGSSEAAPPAAIPYEPALARADAQRPCNPLRDGDDRYIAYTGGTTGMPKGVVWRQEDIFFAAMGGGDPFASGNVVTRPEELAQRLPEDGLTMLVLPPLMHVSAQWSAFLAMFSGGRVVFPTAGHLDPAAVLGLIECERVNALAIVGDAMARPLLAALQRAVHDGTPFDTSSLLVIGSGGAPLSPATRSQLQEVLPQTMIVDGLGASEMGILGTKLHQSGESTLASRFSVNEQTQVLDDAGHPIVPGSGTIGRLARKGRLPLGYYKDEVKTSATFVRIGGERWAVPGDHATVEADGTVVLLGRGSTCINTGGEKVYPEEVEVAIKNAPFIEDAVVVGKPDEYWGERVVAIVEPAGDQRPTLEQLQRHVRTQLAGFKVPRVLIVVDEVERTPAGKPDYAWARNVASGRGADAVGR